MTSKLTQAIQNLRPGSEFAYQENDYSTIEWHVLDGSAPTAKEVSDEIKRIEQAELREAAEKEAKKAELLAKLGITEDEAKLLLS